MSLLYLILIPIATCLLFLLFDEYAIYLNPEDKYGIKISFQEFLKYYTAKPNEWTLMKRTVSYREPGTYCLGGFNRDTLYYFSVTDTYEYRKWKRKNEKDKIHESSFNKLMMLRGRQTKIDLSNQTSHEFPYVITQQDYHYTKVDYTKTYLTLLKHTDGTNDILDENDEIIDDPKQFFGNISFEVYKKEAFPIYIRNDAIKTDYLIDYVVGEYYHSFNDKVNEHED